MVYSCNYPIWHTFNTEDGGYIEYIISYLRGSDYIDIFNGTIQPFNQSSLTTRIDISDICQDYLDTNYESLSFNGNVASIVPSHNNTQSTHTFIVQSGSNIGEADVSYNVAYDYNTDYISIIGDTRCISNPISYDVDPRQRLNIVGYNIAGSSQLYSYQLNATSPIDFTVNATSLFSILSVDLSLLALKKGDVITMRMGAIGSEVGVFKYNVVEKCRNRFAIYYVNKSGGLDSILMSGRSIEGWNPDRTDVRLYNDRGNRQDFEQERIYAEIDHTFELNTGLLSDENGKRIDELIYSPKIFIHDLDNDTITSALITNTTYTVKEHRYDTFVQYTITIKESQKQRRR